MGVRTVGVDRREKPEQEPPVFHVSLPHPDATEVGHSRPTVTYYSGDHPGRQQLSNFRGGSREM